MVDDSLAFGLDWDRDYLVNFAIKYRRIFWPVSVVIIHPFSIYVLIWKASITLDCKIAFVLQHVTLMFFNFYNDFLYEMYPLAPFPVFFCTGYLCDGAMDGSTLLTGLAFWTILLCLPYIFLILRTHQRMLLPGSPFKMDNRVQFLIILFLTSILVSNLIGFRLWAVDTLDKAEILEARKHLIVYDCNNYFEKQEISWAKEYSSTFLVLGRKEGDIGNFMFELLILLASVVINFSYYVFLTSHAVYTIENQLKRRNSKTYEIQLRFIHSLTIQAFCSALFFIMPLIVLFVALAVIRVRWLFPHWFIAPFRVLMLLMYSSSSIPTSFICLWKNPWFRQQIRILCGRAKGMKKTTVSIIHKNSTSQLLSQS